MGQKKSDSPIRIGLSEVTITGRMLYHRAVTENSWRDKGRTKASGGMENSQSARIAFMVKFSMQDFFLAKPLPQNMPLTRVLHKIISRVYQCRKHLV